MRRLGCADTLATFRRSWLPHQQTIHSRRCLCEMESHHCLWCVVNLNAFTLFNMFQLDGRATNPASTQEAFQQVHLLASSRDPSNVGYYSSLRTLITKAVVIQSRNCKVDNKTLGFRFHVISNDCHDIVMISST